jgi:CheY-like chemotaxis protein
VNVFSTAAVFHVLAIEDNPADSYLLKEAFLECGETIHLVVVAHQKEAWALLQSQPVDLLITHAGGGIEEIIDFVRQLRSHPQLHALPLVLLTGRYQIEAAYAAGVNVVLRKSANLDVLFEKIKALVHFWSQVAERPSSIPQKSTESLRNEGEPNHGSRPFPVPFSTGDADILYPDPQEGPVALKSRLPQLPALRGRSCGRKFRISSEVAFVCEPISLSPYEWHSIRQKDL